MKIFHGSFCKIEVPKIIEGRYHKDFGRGFYCTKIQIQAEKWAKKNPTPVVNVYEYENSNALKCFEFGDMTEEWLDFIVRCRQGEPHNFDVVSGAMADDQIWNYIADFIDGVITREQFWVLTKFNHPTHQIAFCTNNALKNLNFVGSYEV